MEKNSFNRRDWLRTSLLSAGGALALPHLSFASSANFTVTLDADKNAIYSPFFKEYLPDMPWDESALKAKLNANENPYGPSPKALEAVKAHAAGGNRYAWKELFALIDKIAAYEGVAADNIIMGPGSSDLLEKFGMLSFLNKGNVVSADPAYMSLIRVAEAMGASWKGIPLKEDWSHDLDAMEKAIDAETKLVYICNPNNPTATITEAKKLKDFCIRVSEKVPVFVDEAYLDFLEEGQKQSMVNLVAEGKNIIVARTFSKIYGMAGLRVGYAVAPKSTIDQIQNITRGGMGISLPSVYGAIEAMEDKTFIDQSRTLNAQSRDYVYTVLDDMKIDYVASHTSFIIFPIEMEGKEFLTKMRAENVGVRAFQFKDQNWCRVSMGTLEEMEIFASALKKVLV
jgi:histidinol-phosphate aminotransferase